ncbi:penicillin-binding protein 2 [Kushneria pakistanensis]|uniref:Peptidoglycan D,D-transpeptidase MrdA n=1 Tax=Kushneria pakistanensis TaxID=1508770 RepID=A0ABQ3FCU9_9GAMM|nr:penicillin-binding protein 2 [Kushneria pakistanensis]GHC18894.1 penicillin-binding protein 2 [Kushneria pakistanensis]
MRPRRATLKDSEQQARIFRHRSIVAAFFVLIMFSGLIGRMVWLQVVQHDIFITRSDKNRMRVEPLPPNRGLILDRNHEVLAENRPTYNLTLVREQAGDVGQTIARLINILDLPEDQHDVLTQRSRERLRSYEPALLLSDLNEDQIARVAVNRYRLPGVEVEAQLIRYYPDGEWMSHVLGYVGRISQDDQQRIDTSNYAGTHFIGKTGIERFYEDELHGQAGVRRIETNARGRALREISRTPPQPGKNLTLTLDSKLQKLGHELLKGKRGAIVAIEPDTGAILAMVSEPGFDNNKFVTGIDTKSYAALRDDIDMPLFNRASRGAYPPASTVKPYMASAGLEYGLVQPSDSVYDPGYYQLPNDSRRYRNWLRWGHGRVDMKRAITVSNDTYFFSLAHRMGIDRLSEFMHKYGFGEDHSLDVWGAGSGLMPSRDWKRGRYNQAWYPGETLSVGIGQGYWLATPLQMATAVAVLANDGRWVRPHLAMQVGDQQIEPPFENTPDNVELDNPRWWDLIHQAMENVMVGGEGSGRASGRNLQYRMAGKSGTAQVFTLGQKEKYNAAELEERLHDHALFTAYGPVDDPKIALAVIIENGGGGSKVAAPIAREMLDAWILPGLKSSEEAQRHARQNESAAQQIVTGD